MSAREFKSRFGNAAFVKPLAGDVHLRLVGGGQSHLYPPAVAREVAQAILDAADEAERPPVVTFQPGDHVRLKAYPELEYIVLERGHVVTRGLGAPRYRTDNSGALPVGVSAFTSEHFERVEV